MYNYITHDEVIATRNELQSERNNFKEAIKAQKKFDEVKPILMKVRELEATLQQVQEALQHKGQHKAD